MQWNRIDIDKEIVLSNPMYLEIMNTVKISIKVNNDINTKLVIIGNNDYDLNIELSDNACLTVNSINKNNSVNININLNNKSSITYNHSVVSNSNSVNNFTVNHMTSNTVSNITNNGINLASNKLFFTIDGIIKKGLSNIICNQSSKIINFEMGESKIIPNLIIDSNDIIANHAAYIGEIGEEEKFYLKSRGIGDIDIKNIIYKATMLGKMDLMEEKEELYKRINEWW